MMPTKPMKRIEVLFENEFCLVLNKPAGLAVQGGAGVGASLDQILGAAWNPRPLLVHRLDKDTSGVIVTAKTREAAARFSVLFGGGRGDSRAGGVLKRYLGVCAGLPRPGRGVIRGDLVVRGAVKAALTTYRLLGTVRPAGAGECSRLELELGTGRTHQIRRHLASIGHPILGDDKYGDFALNRGLRRALGLKRLLLHASYLCVPEALAGFPGGMTVSAPLPEYFAPFWEES
jgi:23S rRNA pseudouridine955/2504/2580 synthase